MRVTHGDRDDLGGDAPAWTPNDLTVEPPDVGMVKVQWADGLNPSQLYWEYAAELHPHP